MRIFTMSFVLVISWLIRNLTQLIISLLICWLISIFLKRFGMTRNSKEWYLSRVIWEGDNQMVMMKRIINFKIKWRGTHWESVVWINPQQGLYKIHINLVIHTNRVTKKIQLALNIHRLTIDNITVLYITIHQIIDDQVIRRV